MHKMEHKYRNEVVRYLHLLVVVNVHLGLKGVALEGTGHSNCNGLNRDWTTFRISL